MNDVNKNEMINNSSHQDDESLSLEEILDDTISKPSFSEPLVDDDNSLKEVPSTIIYYFDIISDILVLFGTKNEAHFASTILFIALPVLLNLYFKYNISKRLTITEVLTSILVLDALI
jgi:hypothetical protein